MPSPLDFLRSKKNETELSDEDIKEIYEDILEVLNKYCDLREDYYNIVALWVIGTYFHKTFPSYPYLFFNAMRGSGKSRILNLIKSLAWNGKHVVSMSESVLFRTASTSTFCIDEFERVASKDKAALRELLNAAYKNGMCVERSKKVKSMGSEDYVVEKFDVYCPVVMANIWGMDNVLSDRCITLILEKSTNPMITMLIEDFDNNEKIKEIKQKFGVVSVVKLWKNNIYTTLWNDWLINYTYYKHNIKDNKYINYLNLFEKVKEAKIDSRNLELFFPLFMIADKCGGDILNKTIQTAQKIVSERKEEDVMENRDVSLLDFIAYRLEDSNDFYSVTELVKQFKEHLKEDDEDVKWINSKWFGRALKRLSLVVEKRRLARGIEIRVNFPKAREKILLFKEKPIEEEQPPITLEKVKNGE